MDEAEALDRLGKKDEAALVWLIERYAPYVNTVIYNIIGTVASPCDVEEVSSDVFLVLWQNAAAVQKGKLKAYLGAVARNKAREKLRSLGGELPLEEDVLSISNLEYDLEEREQAELVRAAVEAMPLEDREIFLRHYYYFQPLARIAEELSMNLSTVKTRLRRGREKLKDELKRRGCDVE